MPNISKKIWYEKIDSFNLQGNDARKFLNGLTTNNLMDKNQIVQTCLLSPKGILKSLLEVHFYEKFLKVLVLAGNTIEIKKYFENIIFPSDDVSISKTDCVFRIQEVDGKTPWRDGMPKVFEADDQELDLFKKNINLMNDIELREWKVNHAIPLYNFEINGKNNPLELGLRDLIDFKKGCFLGQETMAKIRNAISLKKEIRVWKTKNQNFSPNEVNLGLFTSSTNNLRIGQITSFLQINKNLYVGLALIKRKYLDNENKVFSAKFGEISFKKSLSSTFMEY